MIAALADKYFYLLISNESSWYNQIVRGSVENILMFFVKYERMQADDCCYQQLVFGSRVSLTKSNFEYVLYNYKVSLNILRGLCTRHFINTCSNKYECQ